jgi:4-carboxymuconolactone decarboxylase
MNDKRQDAIKLVAEMISEEVAEVMAQGASSDQFGAELGDLAMDSVFALLWTRPGLSRRDRSLVTLGILIALRAADEMRYHIPIALKNGLSRDEIAEVIYHASGYAGFPAAASARNVAKRILDDLDQT